MSTKPEQFDLFNAVETNPATRPTAMVISALPHIARRMWRERMLTMPNNPGDVVMLEASRRRHA